MKKLINPYLDKQGYNCFGCSPTNPIGLHLEFWEDGEDVVTTWSPCVNYDGWVETLHGGIISTLIDELANWVLSRRLQAAGVTTKLEVKFRRPVSTRDPKITLRGHITGNVRPRHAARQPGPPVRRGRCYLLHVRPGTLPADGFHGLPDRGGSRLIID